VRFARDALAKIPAGAAAQGEMVLTGKVSRGEPGKARCPACRAFLLVTAMHANKRVRCNRCRASSLVEFPTEGVAVLTLLQLHD
jgi:hypothetical protein